MSEVVELSDTGGETLDLYDLAGTPQLHFLAPDFVQPWPDNPRTIDRDAFESLKASIKEDPGFMLQRPLLVQLSSRFVYAGNMRLRALEALFTEGWQPTSWPHGRVPVILDDIDDDTAAERALRDNNTWGQFQEQQLGELVGRLAQHGRPVEHLGFDGPRLSDLLASVGMGTNEQPTGTPDDGSRKMPLDMVFTVTGRDHTCCIGVACGLKYGCQSRVGKLCPWAEDVPTGAHRLLFADNDYGSYDHALHLDFVQRYRPKYATVRDIMTEQQCRDAGIAYYPLDQILDWAAELAQHAEHVIVIPKFDCFDQLPDAYILGYSIPTSHGGTPLPVQAFAGRRVHLLGGSWKAQLSYLDALGDDVVSIDNNYLLHAARYGQFTDADGQLHNLKDLGFGEPYSTWASALSLSAGFIARRILNLVGASDERAEPDLPDDGRSAEHGIPSPRQQRSEV